MKNWLFWVGVSFIIGGFVSLALNQSVQSNLSALEDLSGYSIGWIVAGLVFIAYSLIKARKEGKS